MIPLYREGYAVSNEETAVKVKNGEREKLAALWERVERFVAMRAGNRLLLMGDRYAACGVSLDDLLQEGFLAILDATETFDPQRGARFVTWLDYYLRQRWNGLAGFRGRPRPLNEAGSMDAPLTEDGGTLFDLLADPGGEKPFEDAPGIY